MVAALRWFRHPDAAELQRALVDGYGKRSSAKYRQAPYCRRWRTLEDVSMAIVERTWSAGIFEEAREKGHVQGRKQDIKQGITEGLEQGIEQQRQLLCRTVAAPFGADTAAHLISLVRGMTHWPAMAGAHSVPHHRNTDLEPPPIFTYIRQYN